MTLLRFTKKIVPKEYIANIYTQTLITILNRVCFSEYKSHTINHVDMLISSEDCTLHFFSIGSRNRQTGALRKGKCDSDLKGRVRTILSHHYLAQLALHRL